MGVICRRSEASIAKAGSEPRKEKEKYYLLMNRSSRLSLRYLLRYTRSYAILCYARYAMLCDTMLLLRKLPGMDAAVCCRCLW